MAMIWQSVPDAEVLLSLSPEEIGRFLISHIASRPDEKMHPSVFDGELFSGGRQHYPTQFRHEILDVLMEGWTWLESEALLVLTSSTSNGWCKLSRRAKALTDPKKFEEYQLAKKLPRDVLHAAIKDRVWMNIMRGDFDLGVFEAMRAVEIAVRDASGINEIGVKLMRLAFKPEGGPLADPDAENGEREARMHLFAGAIGSYKNPISHRHVPLDDPGEVIEQVMLANHLLRIVDSCRIPQN